ncbi:MAG TPA: NB-ARC domain-containing protein, partial [Ktedonobacteraceae bacterium]|nr:NB-ARC domain-containing protein [Ktedonobacteraceae bacterium]
MQRTSSASTTLSHGPGARMSRGHLPHILNQLSPFLGRQQEMKAICKLLSSPSIHLLTLTGIGGVGKTRLALQVAHTLAEDFVDGVYLVFLASITDPTLVLPTIARALGLGEGGDQSLLERLQAHIQEKSLLFLLDNFEQVITAAPLLWELVLACPHLKILVTSREKLRIHSESIYTVAPLELPDLKHLSDLKTLFHYPALQLFFQQAQFSRPDFQMTNENIQAIAELCVHLEGIPLAIELAATYIRLLSPQKLLRRLERRLAILAGGVCDGTDRQQTLGNTVKWSYNLLNVREQQLFRRLAIFAGDCTLEAVESVCHRLDGQCSTVLKDIASLLDKHLLQQVTLEDGEGRLLMLEMLREFAQECLEISGEGEITHHAHARYYSALVLAAEPGL